MSQSIFYANAGMGKNVKGVALVAKDGFSARYDLDRIHGVFSRPEHKLAGESYRDRMLVLDAAKGGVATAWMLYEMAARGIVPAALVLNTVNPIMVQGAALAGIHYDFRLRPGHHPGHRKWSKRRNRAERSASVHPCGRIVGLSPAFQALNPSRR